MSWLSNLFGRRDTEVEAPEPQAELVVPRAERTGRLLPRFLHNAGSQRRPTGKPGDRVRARMREAFTPAFPVMDASMYAGRTTVLRTLIRAIEDQQLHAVVLGARGIGKTSTLHVLARVAEEAHYLVRYVSCGEETRFEDLFRSVLSEIPLLYHRAYDPTADEVEEGLSFADLLPQGPINVSTISDVLNKIEGTRVLIMLDEFDRAESDGFRRSIAELIKNLSDRASRVQIVIAGVAQNLNELIEHIPSIRRNILGLLVPRMSDEEVTEMIRNGEKTSGIAFSQAAVDAICQTSQGMPYLTGLISQHAGLFALEENQLEVSRDHVVQAVRQTEQELALRLSPAVVQRIERLCEGARADELGAVSVMSMQRGGRFLPSDLRPDGDVPAAPAYLRDLTEAGLIAPVSNDAEGAYAFVDDAIPAYIWVRLSSRLFR